MPQVSDVTEERTGGRGEELEQDDEVHSLLTYESSPSARGELRQINTTVERTEPLPTNPTEILTVAQHSSTTATIKHPHNTNQMLSSPRQLGRGRRRLYRRIRKAVVNFFTHELPNLRSPESIRALPWRARVNLYLSNPEESQLGWRLQQLLMLVIFVNIGTMASETVDGPRFGSSDPGYPYMPGGSVFNALEALFTFLFVIEFAFRWLSTPSQKQFWSSIRTWITFLGAIAALPRLGLLAIGAETSRVETFVYNFRILRAIRLILLAHAYVGTKVLFRAVIAAIPPLTITVRYIAMSPAPIYSQFILFFFNSFSF
ncbi:unnamed protein product [Phytophthora lilii]|uniref:Unnamed protein product n=1 Tax=Phytophthora lilii TaxID=2077276 RepID=A0A9W6XHD9_9STRA|nr:unnamed protein product [Phytophthora lilii]